MKSVLRATLVLAVFATLCGSAAMAQDAAVPWTFVEAGYLNVDPDDPALTSDGGDNWFAGGSFGFLKNFHAFGRYVDGEVATNYDLSYWRVGAGWHGLLGEKADLLAEVAWIDSEVADIGDDGYRLTGGIRWRPIPFFEADGFVNWDDYSDAGSEESYELRALVYFGRLGVGAGYEFADSSEQWNVFARFNFGAK